MENEFTMEEVGHDVKWHTAAAELNKLCMALIKGEIMKNHEEAMHYLTFALKKPKSKRPPEPYAAQVPMTQRRFYYLHQRLRELVPGEMPSTCSSTCALYIPCGECEMCKQKDRPQPRKEE